uniref:CCHC-type domain-containing protein n=1 Tax=Tanacetum cinerariifolium TaxID=118510 RepID=A0A6L2J501_TANCI|nr:hypothetical protein [Tanacetum cinerariifolium]
MRYGGICFHRNSNSQNLFDYSPQPQYETYLCELCGNNSHYGYDCPPQFLLVYEQEPCYNQNYNENYYPHYSSSFLVYENYGGSHATFQCQPMDQNFNYSNSSSFDQYQPPQSFVTQQLSQRSNEDIQLEMAKLIKNNRILLNNNIFPHEETSMSVLLAKERILKLIQAWDEKQIKSWSLSELLLQLSNDSRTIDEMLKQRVKQPWERFYEIKHAFTDKQYQPDEIQELMSRLLVDVRNINEKLSDYTNSLSLNHPIFYDNDENSREYLEKSSKAITPDLPTEEPEYSLSMGDEHLSTISETESNELIKSSVDNFVLILRESEVTSDNESECDVPVKMGSFLIFTTFSNPLFNCNDDFTSSDDESLSNEDVSMENFKIYSNPLFDDEEIICNKIDPHYFNAESNLIESFPNRDTLFDYSPKFDYLEEFSGELMPTNIINKEHIKREHEEYISLMKKLLTINSFPRPLENFYANTIVESLASSPIPVEDSDSQREEIDLFLDTDDLMPPGKNESSNFDQHDDPSFPRPPPEPPDVEIFFDFKPDTGVLTTKVVKGISEHYVFMPNILPTLPTFDPLYPVYDTFLSFSSKNEDKVFKPGILSYLLVSHRDKITSDLSENSMMMYGWDIPFLDVSYLHFYPS